MIKTTRDIEGKYMDYLGKLVSKEIVPVGPLIQVPVEKLTDDSTIMDWLNKKDASSVVFVSFGTECFLSEEEIEQAAYGLELSGVHFVWAVRFHAGGKMSLNEALPKEFGKIKGERGMVIEGWVPQAKILKHSSIGGFVSHCGWSSIVEAMMFGVPIIAMPMQLDQPFNAKLVIELGVGMEVQRGENRKLCREEVASVIRKVVLQEEGQELRKKAGELSQRMMEQGDGEMDLVVKKLVQLVKES